MHTTIALHLVDKINSRSIDQIVTLEEAIMTKPSVQHEQEVLKFIQNSEGQALDKLRCLLIYYLSHAKDFDKTKLKTFETALKESGADTSALNYLIKSVPQSKVKLTQQDSCI